MVVVALGEPGTPVMFCASAGVIARKKKIKAWPEVNDFLIFALLSNLPAERFFCRGHDPKN